MRVYVGMDDTDRRDSNRGTGKLARWMERELPPGCTLWGVVRQQLPVCDDIPYTSHNSAACLVVDLLDASLLEPLVLRTVAHVERHFVEGSDPGICVVSEKSPALPALVAFGHQCARRVVTQREALESARGAHLSGHGGTCDGIIGAAAAAGLTAHGWSGRFIEKSNLRGYPERVSVKELEDAGMLVASLDRDTRVPHPADTVLTNRWLRPRLWGGRPVLPVVPLEEGVWRSLGEKRRKGHGASGEARPMAVFC